jgi:hypothetical protein
MKQYRGIEGSVSSCWTLEASKTCNFCNELSD